jgi:glycosyltransferase involved in cell wall biosynthesis
MRVLVAHNAYQHRGGEDAVMEAEVEMLRARGHTVELFLRHNDEIEGKSRVNLAFQTLWSSPVAKEFETVLRTFIPDVVHVHNTFPLISPAIYWVAARVGVPVVQTLHNFRSLCPQATFLREAKVCEDCLGRLPWRGAVRACYRDSKLQSTVLASMLTFHRAIGTWQSKVTRYIALNEFCRSKFIAGGLPAERIVLKPNFVDFEAAHDCGRSDFLFVGRLSPEKGIDVLVAAADLLRDLVVRVAGSGPDAMKLQGARCLLSLGALDTAGVKTQMSRAIALVLPSICYESFPRTLVEAFASSLPVIASRMGPLSELVKDGVTGLLFESGNAQDLASKIIWAQQHPEQMLQMGRNARLAYEAEFTAERNHEQLISIYQDAIDALDALKEKNHS